MWKSTSIHQADTSEKYLTKTLDHYQRIQQGLLQSFHQGKTNDVQHIIDAYRAIEL